MVNFSLSGMRVELLRDWPQGFRRGQPFDVEIPNEGCLELQLRWRRGRRMGFSFRSREQARALLWRYTKYG